jgi:uncharacterized membrane protein YqjE
VTSGQNNSNGSRHATEGGRWAHDPNGLPSIPLSEERGPNPDEQSIGELVRDATTHLSTLVRSEVELAKIEIGAEVKKGLRGSIFFIIALTVLLFSLFFFFFALGELLSDLGLYRSAAFGIIFGFMLLVSVLFALLGWRKVRKIRAPQRTISEAKETAQLGKRLRRHEDERFEHAG